MTESVETGDIPPKITADASAEARDRPRENEGEKQPLEKQVLILHCCRWEYVLL